MPQPISPQQARVIVDDLGDPRDLRDEIQRFRRAARILSSKHPRLIDRYPKQWVAVYEGKVRAAGSTFNSVLAQVDKQGLPRRAVIVRFIDKNQRTMIL